ncbi:MAG: ABC transporter ATP-binding protein [Acidobacteria bacterium]|nr:ABC transporter ATP-binding protein [Acidobacteriota bacterium]
MWRIRLLSATKGRERWEVKALKRRPALALALELLLLEQDAIRHASASDVTGRVLLFFSPDAPGLNTESLLLECLQQLSSQPSLLLAASRMSSPLARIIKSSLPERKHLATPPVLSAAGHILGLLQGASFMAIFNTARGDGPGFLRALGLVRTGSRLFFMTTASILLTAANLLVQHERKRAWGRLAQSTQHNLRTQLLARIETQDMAFFDTYGTGRLRSLVIEDTAQVGNFVERAGDELIEKVLTIIVSGGVLLLVSPSLAFFAGLTLPLILVSSRFFGQRVTDSYARLGASSSDFSQMLENNLNGIAEIKSFTAERQEILRLKEQDARRAMASVDAASISFLQAQLTGGLFSAGFALTAGYGGRLTAAGRISQTEFYRAAFWFPQLLGALTGVEQIRLLYHGANSSAARLAEVLDSEPQIQSGAVHLPAGAVRGEIVFEDVSFGYHPDAKVLENVSFRLKAGETLAIVGPTGSGKSTLLNLLLRFFDVDTGRILLDDIDIRDLNLHSLRAAISLVSQEVHLFEGSVQENILYGEQNASFAEVMESLRDAGAMDLLETLPGGLEAPVGERGHRLSGGERQRVAIARALLKMYGGASILALDEATSHLDAETETAVKRSLGKAATGKSVIIIAHRLSTIRHAHRIIVLERGKVIEEGTHEELLERKGLYASLWQLQNEDPFGGGLEVRISS